jgi:hypothetical protein
MISLLRPLSLGSAKPGGATTASSSYRWWAAVVAALALLSAATIARPIGVEAASLYVSWQAPTTNADGTRLTTLFGYRLYFGTSTPVCQGPSFFNLISPIAAPSESETVAYQLRGLSAGTTYAVAVTAINSSQDESECPPEAVGIAHAAFTAAPSTVDFGSTIVGTSVDRRFTLQNIGTATVSGTAVVSPPFTIVSGSSYTVAPGATQDVVVRFPPTVDGTFVGNINFFADGDTISRGVAGTAMLLSAPPAPGTASLTMISNGKLRDRVGPGYGALAADGVLDGTLTVSLNASGGRTVTRLHLQSSGPGTWEAAAGTSAWVLGVATTFDGPLLNDRATTAVTLPVADGGSFHLFFASDFGGTDFVAGTTLTLTATFSDGTTATALTSVPVPAPSLGVTYIGKLRDRAGLGNVALGSDGMLDGTLAATLSAPGGRRVTRLQLQSDAPGTWDTDAGTPASVLAVANRLDGALLNDPHTMAVNFPVLDDGTFYLFASDFGGFEFTPGATLTLTATLSDGTTATAVTVAWTMASPSPPSLTLSYTGKQRDRVGLGNLGLGADRAPDGTLTAILNASGGRGIMRLQLQSSAGGTWDTDAGTTAWVLGVAATLDGPLLNDPATMAVNFAVPDSGSFRLFGSDYAGIEFAPGATLTLTATFSDGTTARAVTTVELRAWLTLSHNGNVRDRVGLGNLARGADGVLDGTLTATLSATGGRTVTRLVLQSSGPGTWDTDAGTPSWVLAVATTLDGPLLNDPATMAVNFPVADGGTFNLFYASVFSGTDFVAGATLTVTATFSDGTTASATVTAPPSLALSYIGNLRDRVGQGNLALGGDGALDGTLTATLSVIGGRVITGLQLQSSGPGTWDTNAGTSAWALGVATTVDGPLLNDPGTMAVDLLVVNGASLYLFASDYAGIEFGPGATLTLTATFSDGTTATATTVAGSVLTLKYNGKLRDRVGLGNIALGPEGALDGSLTATLSASGGRTVTRLRLESSGPGIWDTDAGTVFWILGVATTPDGPLLNDPATMAVNFPVAEGGRFELFASDATGIEFVPGATLTLTATFSDGTAATAVTIAPNPAPSLSVSYNGKLRDHVAPGSLGLGADGVLDGTFTVTLSAAGGRTITRLQLQSSAPGTWDTDATTSAWVVAVATTLDSALLNNPSTMAVNFAVADGTSFHLFAADYADIEFVSGTTLTVTATFSDGSKATGIVTVP